MYYVESFQSSESKPKSCGVSNMERLSYHGNAIRNLMFVANINPHVLKAKTRIGYSYMDLDKNVCYKEDEICNGFCED